MYLMLKEGLDEYIMKQIIFSVIKLCVKDYFCLSLYYFFPAYLDINNVCQNFKYLQRIQFAGPERGAGQICERGQGALQ